MRTVPQAFRSALRERADIYHFHDPELMPAGCVLRLLGKKVIYDVHEDYSGSMAGKQWIPKPLRRVASMGVHACEMLLARQYSRMIAATPAIAAKFPQDRVSLVQNFPWISELASSNGLPYSGRKPIVAYVGALSNDRGLREMAEAIRLVNEKLGATLVTAGKLAPGAEGELKQLANVQHEGILTRREVATLLERAKVGIVTLHPTTNYKSSQPTKLYEYMSAGLPVVASDFPVWREIIETAQCGLIVDPLDPKAIAQALEWLLTHPAQAEEMGRRGRYAVAEHYNWEKEAKALRLVYAELLYTQSFSKSTTARLMGRGR